MVANSVGKKLSSLAVPGIVGQETLKRVLLAVAVNDDLDGALIAGEKGTAKSTAVRTLAEHLPEQRVVVDCRFRCSPDGSGPQCADCRERDPDDMPVETRPTPVVTLPLGATRDRVVGTLSVEDALAGEASFEPGLLARANRGILYVDEINLLDDHLVDVLLDAAASATNTVERDGVSVSHPAAFTLVGTMNPEEGDLRPQLRDRFALQTTVEGCRDIDDRVKIIDRALGDGADAAPTGGDEPTDAQPAEFSVGQRREAVAAARDRVAQVDLPAEFRATIAELCLNAGVDGHRGDIATARTAVTLAALEERTTVIESDVREAATYTLPHRLRSTPFADDVPDVDDLLADHLEDSADGRDDDGESNADAADVGESEPGPDEDGAAEGGDGDGDNCDPETSGEAADAPQDDERSGDRSPTDDRDESYSDRSDGDDTSGTGNGTAANTAEQAGASAAESEGGEEGNESGSDEGGSNADTDTGTDTAQPLVPGQRRAAIGDAAAPELETPTAETDATSRSDGKHTTVDPNSTNRGARVRTESASGSTGEAGSIDAAASVRAAAARGETTVGSDDLRRAVREGTAAATIVFAVDASASMQPAMRTAKGVVLELLRESYQRRDDIAFVAFAGDDADVLLPPTHSVSLAARHLKSLPTGDRTPLPAGLETASAVVERADTETAVVVLVTDGKATAADSSPTEHTRAAARRLTQTGAELVLVDAGTDSRAGLSSLIVAETDGERVPLSALSAETVRSAVDAATVD
ncbi:VWA domain-containing protein [Natrialba asiatica]|uniref:Protporphyrin IX magnesium chelatase n=1 Tax=Natrialba asiatica (strain ATCC 700177 / DSM 12278 / JCM 9576 / FERM P-10747 / NBRC 102637 / 172P1) TaxID=29540 RepID=M0B932_NATA1|nr:VWA domain-containing protein [Natrialba asiatica]ELZ06154.1 protporphyrin IX magnesium chelatase [Natrialba asiatica DSM 12278]